MGIHKPYTPRCLSKRLKNHLLTTPDSKLLSVEDKKVKPTTTKERDWLLNTRPSTTPQSTDWLLDSPTRISLLKLSVLKSPVMLSSLLLMLTNCQDTVSSTV